MTKKIIGIIILLLIVIGGFYFYKKKSETIQPVACTMEAMLCPDGSYVGRSGPKCEFAKCPDSQLESTTIGAPPGGTISGTVTLGPTCPIERIPPDPQCAPKPLVTDIEIRDSTKQTVIETIKSDTDGKFQVNLLPGSYDLKALTADGSVYPRCDKVTVTVKSAQTTTTNISCDTGIR